MKYSGVSMIYVLSYIQLIFSVHAVATTTLDDAAVFALFDQANTADIWTARLGVKYGHSEDVRQLAKMVATDHESVQQMGRALANKLGIIPSPPVGDSTAQALAKSIAELQAKSGIEFDKAYLRHEIAFHQSVIDTIKGELLPAIKNTELKTLVEKVLPGFQHHLEVTRITARKIISP